MYVLPDYCRKKSFLTSKLTFFEEENIFSYAKVLKIMSSDLNLAAVLLDKRMISSLIFI